MFRLLTFLILAHTLKHRKIKCSGNLRGCEHCGERGQVCLYAPRSDEERRKDSMYKRKLKRRHQRQSLYLDVDPPFSSLPAYRGTSSLGYQLTSRSSPTTEHSDLTMSISESCTSALPRAFEAYFQDPSTRQPRHLRSATSAPTTPIVPQALEACFQNPSVRQGSFLPQAYAVVESSRPEATYWETVQEKPSYQHRYLENDLDDLFLADQRQALLSSPVISESASDITSARYSPQQPHYQYVLLTHPGPSQGWNTNVHGF